MKCLDACEKSMAAPVRASSTIVGRGVEDGGSPFTTTYLVLPA